MLLTIPSAIGLMILAEPIIALIYQHGRFTAEATVRTAEALRFYAIGLVGYSAVKVLAPAFYALDKRNLPMLVSLLSIAINFGLNWFFTLNLGLGHRGLALSTSLVAITNFVILYAMMRRYTGRLETGAMIRTLAKLLVAGALLAGGGAPRVELEACRQQEHHEQPEPGRESQCDRDEADNQRRDLRVADPVHPVRQVPRPG